MILLLPTGGDQTTQERQDQFARYGVEHVLQLNFFSSIKYSSRNEQTGTKWLENYTEVNNTNI